MVRANWVMGSCSYMSFSSEMKRNHETMTWKKTMMTNVEIS